MQPTELLALFHQLYPSFTIDLNYCSDYFDEDDPDRYSSWTYTPDCDGEILLILNDITAEDLSVDLRHELIHCVQAATGRPLSEPEAYANEVSDLTCIRFMQANAVASLAAA